jgi:hypothetical protein
LKNFGLCQRENIYQRAKLVIVRCYHGELLKNMKTGSKSLLHSPLRKYLTYQAETGVYIEKQAGPHMIILGMKTIE